MNKINFKKRISEKTKCNYPLWHPYSSIDKNYKDFSNFVRGEGIKLYDIDGKEYFDATSGLWNVSLGYGNKEIEKAIINQLKRLSFCSLFENTNSTAISAAKKILKLLPSYMKKLFYTCSGSESVELGIKVIRKYWSLKGYKNRNTIISMNNSYHGTYYGSMSVSGLERDMLNGYGPLLENITFFEPGVYNNCTNYKDTGKCNLNCIKELEIFIKTKADSIAGIILEPILASKGVIILCKEYIDYIGYLCEKYHLLLIVDEVATGFYRTGRAFYTEKFKLKPDIICMSKGMNSGYLPLGATVFSENICNTFSESNEPIVHGSTQGGNLISCAACIAAIDQYSKNNIMENVIQMGNYFVTKIKNKLVEHDNVGCIRSEGLIIGIDLVTTHDKNEYLNFEKILFIRESLKKNGLVVNYSDMGLTLFPMLIVNESELNAIFDIIEGVFRKVNFR